MCTNYKLSMRLGLIPIPVLFGKTSDISRTGKIRYSNFNKLCKLLQFFILLLLTFRQPLLPSSERLPARCRCVWKLIGPSSRFIDTDVTTDITFCFASYWL